MISALPASTKCNQNQVKEAGDFILNALLERGARLSDLDDTVVKPEAHDSPAVIKAKLSKVARTKLGKRSNLERTKPEM